MEFNELTRKKINEFDKFFNLNLKPYQKEFLYLITINTPKITKQFTDIKDVKLGDKTPWEK